MLNQIPVGGKDFCQTKQDGCVGIVTAGVHYIGNLGLVGYIYLFLNGQCVKVRAKSNTGTGYAAVNHTDNGVSSDTR